MSRRGATRVRNLLLASLPHADRERLLPTLEMLPLRLRDSLYRPGEVVQHVYFPAGGFCSIVTVLNDGSMVEVATVGREGMLGGAGALGGRSESSATMVQGAAEGCYRMSAEAFRAEVGRGGAFADVSARYAQAFIGVLGQSTACNAVHAIDQRLARWLLMAHDWMEADEFPLTQEFVAMMLAVTRPSVSLAAGVLQKARLITYRRGRVTIRNRRALEQASCECYRLATDLLRVVPAR